jgi:hypothetical protein
MVSPYIAISFGQSTMTGHSLTWKTNHQPDYVMIRQADNWFCSDFLQYISSVGVTVNLACWYFCQLSNGIGTLRRFALVRNLVFIQD